MLSTNSLIDLNKLVKEKAIEKITCLVLLSTDTIDNKAKCIRFDSPMFVSEFKPEKLFPVTLVTSSKLLNEETYDFIQLESCDTETLLDTLIKIDKPQ